MIFLKNILNEISDGKRSYSPGDDSLEEIKNFQSIANYLVYADQNNLIQGIKSQKTMSRENYGVYINILLMGGLTLEGERYLAGDHSNLIGNPMTNNNYTFNNSQGIQIGDLNSQNLEITLQKLVNIINESSGSDEQKVEAKNLLNKFLEHPLVAAVVGAVASNLTN